MAEPGRPDMSTQRLPRHLAEMPPALSGWTGRAADGGLAELFAGRRAAFTYLTRVAIRSACDVLGFKPGDEVLAPAFNCGTELDPLMHAGLEVTLYPVGRDLCIDPDAVAARITSRTRAIYVTHYFGCLQPELAALRTLADSHGLRLIEDCALSLLSGPAPAEGRTGDVAVFCLHKFFPVPDGGVLVTNDPSLNIAGRFGRKPPVRQVAKGVLRAALVRALGAGRVQGLGRRLRGEEAPMASPAPERADMPGHYYFDDRLQDTRMSLPTAWALRGFDVSAAITARRVNWARYRDRLSELPGVEMLIPDLPQDVCPLNMPVLVAGRDQLAAALQREGIGATPWWGGCARRLDWRGAADAVHLKQNLLALPLHQYMDKDGVDHVVARLGAHLA